MTKPLPCMIKKFLVGGNWKLNGNLKLLKEFSSNKNFIEAVECSSEAIEVLICPAFPFLGTAKEAFAGSSISIGAQNCHAAPSGAFTGESEEQREKGETNQILESQLEECLESLKSLNGVDCERLVIAYEPVWAIGTGKVASPQQAQETHHHIRQFLADKISPEHASAFRIIYGGSVSGTSAVELAKQVDIDGFLVGGASLKVDEFTKIIKSI